MKNGTIAAINFLLEHDGIVNVRVTENGDLRVSSSASITDSDGVHEVTVIEIVEPKPKPIRELLGY